MTRPASNQELPNEGQPASDAPWVEDLSVRYDELLEFLLEFTHRQAQWDQRQQQLVDFQRRAVDQLRTTSYELVARHQELEAAEKEVSKHSIERLSGVDDQGKESPERLEGLREPALDILQQARRLEQYEEELKQRIFEQEQISQQTRLQRRKLANQIRAQKSEASRKQHLQQLGDEQNKVAELLDDFRKQLNQEREIASESVAALSQALSEANRDRDVVRDELRERMADIEELKRLVVELQRAGEQRLESLSDDEAERVSKLQQIEADLKQRSKDLDHREKHTRLQRRKIAEQLRTARSEMRAREDQDQSDREEHEPSSVDTDALVQRLAESLSQRLGELQDVFQERHQNIESMISSLFNEQQNHEPTGAAIRDDVATFDALNQLRDDVLGSVHDQLNQLRESIGEPEQVSFPKDEIIHSIQEQFDSLRESISHEPATVEFPREEFLGQVSELLQQFREDLPSPSEETPAQPPEFSVEPLLEQIREQFDQLRSSLPTDESPPSTNIDEIAELLRNELNAQHGQTHEILAKFEQKLDQLDSAPAEPTKSRSKQNDAELAEVRELLRASEQEATRLLDENAMLVDQLKEAQESTDELADAHESAKESVDSTEWQLKVEKLSRQLDERQSEIESLKDQLSQRPVGGPGDESGMTDWEAAKQKLLAELEAFDDADTEQRKERISIEEVIVQTDRVIAEKDEEIAELKHLLSHQSESIGGVAVGAAAIAEALDADEIIMQERENLNQLQEEWKEKVRAAEVELSLERARIARERAELEERLTQHQSEGLPPGDSEDKSSKSASNRGKWLERLGLKDENK